MKLASPSGPAEPSAFEGFWQSRGYGWILELHRNRYALYDRTDLGIVSVEAAERDEFDAAFDRVIARGDNALSLFARGEITRYDFDRIAALPGPSLRSNAAPELNFESFWRVFNQDYAFFGLRKVDWNLLYLQYRPKVHANTDGAVLFDVLRGMIDPLEDNHVVLKGDNREFSSEKNAEVKALMVRELQLDSPSLGLASTIERYQSLVLQRFLRGTGSTAGNRLATWGWVTPQVGYLNILRFFGYTDSPKARGWQDLPERRAAAAHLLETDLAAADEIMARAIGELSTARALIIDVRVNGGGYDRLALNMARWFADKRRLAFTKTARWGDTTTEAQAIYLELDERISRYTKPIYLLTGERTASAGEVFTLALRCLPQVTLVGNRTLGIISDNLRKTLPNEWTVSISNEVYSAPDGTVYEGVGIQPDVSTVVFDPHDFYGGLSAAIEEATRLATCAS